MSDDWREVYANWKGEDAFVGHNRSGGIVQMGTIDGVPGTSPMELLLLGIAGCTGIDIISILTKKRQTVSDFQVWVRGKRAEQPPKVYTEIEVTYHLWGNDLNPKDVEQAIELSEEKYCSASIMLKATASLRSCYHIYQPGEPIQT